MKLYRHFLSCLAITIVLGACGKATPPAVPAQAPTELAALHTPPPEYPPELACAGIGGKTVLSVVIGPQGMPVQVSVVQSSGQAALDASAQTRVREWKFKAATRNGQPIPQTIQVPVDFKPPLPKPQACFAIEERARRGA